MLKNRKSTWSQTGWAIGALLLATLGGATGQPAVSAQQRILVLEGGTLIDGTGRPPVADAVVVVQGSRITAVGKRGEVQVPANANVINLTGRTILPGLIDSHVHTAEFNMPMFLKYGVTTIQDKNNDVGWILAQREALKNGKMKGPRMFVSGSGIHGIVFEQDEFNTPAATTPEEAGAHARRLLLAGVDNLNVGDSITDAQLSSVIAVAKDAGVAVMGHVRNIRKAAELGYKFQEHMYMMAAAIIDPEAKTKIGVGGMGGSLEVLADPKKFPPLIEFMVQQGVYVNPTLVGQWSASAPRGPLYAKELAQLAKDPELAFVPADVREGWSRPPSGGSRDGYANVAEFLRQYSAAGGRVSVGTDAGGGRTVPGLSEHYEMQMLADVGIPPMKIIQGATLWNAEMLKKEKDLGSVEPGKLADFTIIEGDPLADISATMNVRMVIKEGEVMDTKYDPKWVNPIPPPYSSASGRGALMITNVSPAVARQGGPTVTLQIEGRGGFSPNSVVRFDTADLPTQFVSGTKLTATLDAKLLQRSPGLYPLYVVNPGVRGTVSMPAYELIDTASAPATTIPVPYSAYGSARPPLYGPTPKSARQGGQTVTLEIEGKNFAPNAIVRFDTVDLPTRFVSSTKVTATLDAKLLQRNPGGYVLYVLNPGVYGTVSEDGYFLVNLKE